jgi:hypothetical protein
MIVRLTDTDIQEGKRGSPRICPWARAFARAFKAHSASVRDGGGPEWWLILYPRHDTQLGDVIRLPSALRRAVKRYDEGGPMTLIEAEVKQFADGRPAVPYSEF